MIDRERNYVAWVAFLQELVDAHEHLGELISRIENESDFDDDALEVDLGHVYSHMNRAWHTRNLEREIADEEWESASAFPVDLQPV